MDNILQLIDEIITTGIKEHYRNLVNDHQDISQFIRATKEDLDEVGTMIVQYALEALDEAVRETPGRSLEWYIQEREKPNTLATLFGEVHYKRTYYKSVSGKGYCSLSDELVGIEPHDKMDLSLKSKVVELAEDDPYRKSGRNACNAIDLSGQTVMNAIRWLGPLQRDLKAPVKKREAECIFIEADEDHVAMPNGRCGEPKLVYVHEGIEEISKGRVKLKHPMYFGGMYSESDELWAEVEEYIDVTYDRDSIKKIYLSGDRGGWIRKGPEWIQGSEYVVDKYHLLKNITEAGGHIEGACSEIWNAVNMRDREYLEIVLDTIHDDPKSTGKNLVDSFRYIRESFDDTRAYQDEEYNGCSAEGHISHVYSDRMSSRPRVWRYVGIDEMARLRVAVNNGVNIYSEMLKEKKRRKVEIHWDIVDQNILKKRMLAACGEMTHNIPVLNIGEINSSFRFMSEIRGI